MEHGHTNELDGEGYLGHLILWRDDHPA